MSGLRPSWLGLLGAVPAYAKLAWWGLVAPRWTETRPLVVLQAVVLGQRGVLLAVRNDLRGWELPGGTLEMDESDEQALRRELMEETGFDVEVTRFVGEYVRSGFRPHTARVYVCRLLGGKPKLGDETRQLDWFDPVNPPWTLFPWYREPLDDALAEDAHPIARREHQGVGAIWAGLRIDLAMRLWADRAG